MSKRVVVGMSGGVDSAVTAYLLKIAGYDVTGVLLRTWVRADGQESRCCEIDDAQRTAAALGIPFYVKNCAEQFREQVILPFAREYACGRTPNPCVDCNRVLKWEGLLQAAADLGADLVATGHYAEIVRKENGRFTVRQAANAAKDQTYMLYRLTQEQLASTVMPLGRLSKEEVRGIARAAGIPVAEKSDSQEICFVPDGHYAEFIETETEVPVTGPGNFVDEEGRVLGTHKGILHYTIGQRRHLGLPMGYPVFVKKIDAERNEVVIAEDRDLYGIVLYCDALNFMSIPEPAPGTSFRAHVRIRYHHGGEDATVEILPDGTARVVFDAPVRAAAPGQSAVFYDTEGCIIGGGKIGTDTSTS